jgi:CDP-glucose 4,6-dehydratase
MLEQLNLRIGFPCAEVAGYSVNFPSLLANFEVLGLERRIRHYCHDVRDLEGLTKVFDECNPRLVFHLAAQPI